MHGAADLLVVEDAAGEAVDPLVQTEADLAQITGARVEVEHSLPVVLARLGPRRDDPTGLEFELDPDQLAPASTDREPAPHPALRASFVRSSEHLARGHVAPA